MKVHVTPDDCHATPSKIPTVFGNAITGAFQITFHVKMHVNDVFLFFKNYF